MNQTYQDLEHEAAKSPSEIDKILKNLWDKFVHIMYMADETEDYEASIHSREDELKLTKQSILALALEIVDGAELDPNYNVYYLEGAAMIKAQLRAAFRKAFQ